MSEEEKNSFWWDGESFVRYMHDSLRISLCLIGETSAKTIEGLLWTEFFWKFRWRV